jgi:hypothetical protein
MIDSQENGVSSTDTTIPMRLEGSIYAYDYGEFDMPKGAEIDSVDGRWGVYHVTFTDPVKYPMIEVQCYQEVDGKFPDNVRVTNADTCEEWYDEGKDTV